MADPAIATDVEEFWAAAIRHLPGDLDGPAYVGRLRGRFSNARIEHRLDQIQEDAASKYAVRIQPVVDAERAAGRRLDVAERVRRSISTLT
jgi:fructuronate reductase